MTRLPNLETIASRSARVLLRALGGWRYVGPLPEPRKAVCLAVPHTDNLDGLLLVLLAQSVGLKITWMIKDAWTRPPFGPLVRAVGAIGIDRSRPHGMVEQMIEAFDRAGSLYLVIPPEGTRGRTEFWKSGFYWIARGADVPVVPGALDYRTRTGRFGPPIRLTGDVRADMDAIRAFYAQVAPTPRHPERFGPIRLREEVEGESSRA